METVKKYKTADGLIWDTEEAASVHETLMGRVKEIVSALGERSDKIANGKGYIQHDPKVVKKIKASFYQLALTQQGFAKSEGDENIPGEYWIGRYLNDSNSALYSVWNRLQCIDDLGREFDQQFFKNNPNKAKLIAIKP